jgi:hypothetical protein
MNAGPGGPFYMKETGCDEMKMKWSIDWVLFIFDEKKVRRRKEEGRMKWSALSVQFAPEYIQWLQKLSVHLHTIILFVALRPSQMSERAQTYVII